MGALRRISINSVQRRLGFDSSAHGDFHLYEGSHGDPGARFSRQVCRGGSRDKNDTSKYKYILNTFHRYKVFLV
jgi:hypothetical protein